MNRDALRFCWWLQKTTSATIIDLQAASRIHIKGGFKAMWTPACTDVDAVLITCSLLHPVCHFLCTDNWSVHPSSVSSQCSHLSHSHIPILPSFDLCVPISQFPSTTTQRNLRVLLLQVYYSVISLDLRRYEARGRKFTSSLSSEEEHTLPKSSSKQVAA
jgi:hypothetical protein